MWRLYLEIAILVVVAFGIGAAAAAIAIRVLVKEETPGDELGTALDDPADPTGSTAPPTTKAAP